MRIKRKRINMRIPEDLMEFIKKYAEVRGTTVTDDYILYLSAKKTEEEQKATNEQSA